MDLEFWRTSYTCGGTICKVQHIIKYPSRVVEKAFKLYLRAINTNPYVMEDLYKNMREQDWKEFYPEDDFPEGYIEKLIEKIQARIDKFEEQDKKSQFNFGDEEEEIVAHTKSEAFEDVKECLYQMGYGLKEITSAIKQAELHLEDKDDTQKLLETTLKILSGV